MVNGKLIAANRLLDAGDRPGRVEAIEDITAEINREVVAAAAADNCMNLRRDIIDLLVTDMVISAVVTPAFSYAGSVVPGIIRHPVSICTWPAMVNQKRDPIDRRAYRRDPFPIALATGLHISTYRPF